MTFIFFLFININKTFQSKKILQFEFFFKSTIVTVKKKKQFIKKNFDKFAIL